MPEKKFQVGDVVRLKSGGPPMTVIRCPHTDVVRCGYFAAYEYREMLELPPEALEKSEVLPHESNGA